MPTLALDWGHSPEKDAVESWNESLCMCAVVRREERVLQPDRVTLEDASCNQQSAQWGVHMPVRKAVKLKGRVG